MGSKLDSLPTAFIWRRLHSLTGLWLVIFLIEHLVTNSQAALLFGESGQGFVRMVNFIHNLPYLTVIEVGLLGIPILIHGVWGIKYARTAKANSGRSDGTKPSLGYARNRAFTWQRLSSWILLVLLVVHVAKFRFLEYPGSVNVGSDPTYFVTVSMDKGLYTVADRLDVKLYDSRALDQMKQGGGYSLMQTATYDPSEAERLGREQDAQLRQNLVDALTKVSLKEEQVVATSSSFGTVSLLTVRDTFKSWMWVGVYTIFVLSAVFHAFNGLWTSMLTWGWVIKKSAQTRARQVAIGLMILIGALGLIAVWGTYFINLRV